MTPAAGRRARALLTLGVWLFAVALFAVAGGVMDGRWAPWTPLWLAGVALGGLGLSALLMAVVGRLEGRPRRIGWPLIVAAVLAAAASQAVLDFQVLRWAHGAAGETFRGDPTFSIGFNLLVYLWLFGLYATALKLQRAGERSQFQERQLLEARAAADRARLDALRHQVNPHFLFNTLNGLQTLIDADRKAEATLMLRRLSSFLRASLEGEHGDMSRLGDELELIEAYLEVERARFGDRLRIEIDCPPDLTAAPTPRLMLHPLVENAMTHAVATSRGPVTVRIACRRDGEDLLVGVEDTGTPAAGQTPGLGLGLDNVRNRLALTFGPRAALTIASSEAGFRAEVRQPLA